MDITGKTRMIYAAANTSDPILYLDNPSGGSNTILTFAINGTTKGLIRYDSSGNCVIGMTGSQTLYLGVTNGLSDNPITINFGNTISAPQMVLTSGSDLAVRGGVISTNARLHASSLTTTQVIFRCDSADNATADVAQINLNTNATATIANSTTFAHNTSGTPAAGFGQAIKFTLESIGNPDQNAASINVLWTDATHVSRSAAFALYAVDNGAALAEKWRIAGNGLGTGTLETQTGLNGSQLITGQVSENITLSTSGATTDSTIDLPANSIILSVTARITTTIAGVDSTTLSIGDPTTAARFGTTGTLTAGTTVVGLNHQQGSVSTDATGPVQTSAAKVRLTLSGGADNTPSAGAVRITIHYMQFIAPTS
jgi:hypothetical protein